MKYLSIGLILLGLLLVGTAVSLGGEGVEVDFRNEFARIGAKFVEVALATIISLPATLSALVLSAINSRGDTTDTATIKKRIAAAEEVTNKPKPARKAPTQSLMSERDDKRKTKGKGKDNDEDEDEGEYDERKEEEGEEEEEEDGIQWKQVRTPTARRRQSRGRSRTPARASREKDKSASETKARAKNFSPSRSQARTSPKTPAARGKSPSKTAARGKKVPGPRSRSAQAQNKLGYIENDIVQSRPANHMTVAADVKAWNASEDPVHSKKPAARKPRASSRKR